MNNHNGISNPGAENVNPADAPISSKGKGKAVDTTHHDISMDDDDDSSDEDDGAEDDANEEPEEADEDNMEEISTENIINNGRRTRGKNIDFAKAAQDAGEDLDDDEDDDDDFEERDEDAMEH